MICLLILLLIIFIPFPIHVTFEYEGNNTTLRIYKFKVYPSKTSRKSLEKIICDLSSKEYYLKNIKLLYKKAPYVLSRFTLSFNIDLYYGLEDAFETSMIYGSIHSVFNIIYTAISSHLKIKKFNAKINPIFNRCFIKLNVKSIIFISFANIIYIALIVLKNLKKGAKLHGRPKEVN